MLIYLVIMPRKKLIKPQYITLKLMLILPFFSKERTFFSSPHESQVHANYGKNEPYNYN